MPEQLDIIAELYEHLLRISTGEPPLPASGTAPVGPARTAVVMAWPGQPIDPTLYGKPYNSATRQGSWQAVELFSSLVDVSPMPGPYFVPTYNSIEAAYRLLLDSTAARPPASPFTRQLARSREAFVRTEATSQDGRRRYQPSSAAPPSWCDPGAENLWQSISLEIGSNSPAAPNAATPPPGIIQWKPNDFRNLPVWRLAPRIDPIAPSIIPGRPDIGGDPIAPFADPAKADLHSLGARFDGGSSIARDIVGSGRLGSLALPNLVHPAFARMLDYDAVSSAAGFRRGGGTFDPIPNEDNPFIVPSLPASPPERPVEESAVTSALRISFKFIRVAIVRTWFDNLLLELPGWYLSGLPRGFFSTGTVDRSNTGHCPLIPTSFLAIRDLSLRGNWSAPDAALARRASSGQEAAAFGPFTLSAGSTHSSFDGTSLGVPGIQVVSWTVNAMPFAPPS